jgi:hypothetical protein
MVYGGVVQLSEALSYASKGHETRLVESVVRGRSPNPVDP